MKRSPLILLMLTVFIFPSRFLADDAFPDCDFTPSTLDQLHSWDSACSDTTLDVDKDLYAITMVVNEAPGGSNHHAFGWDANTNPSGLPSTGSGGQCIDLASDITSTGTTKVVFAESMSFSASQYVIVDIRNSDCTANPGGSTWGNSSTGAPYRVWHWSDPSAPATPFLSFPLKVSCRGRRCTAFSAMISSVMDHSVPTGYNCNLRGNCDGVVLAYNGEEGRRPFGANCPPPGYKNESGTDFLTGVVNYVGARCPPPRSEAFRFPGRFLNYDGHSGYDYVYDGVPILAAADGVLEIPTSDPINNSSGSSPQERFNTLRIIHPNGYETWYLHARAGSECVAFGTCPNRPAPGDTIRVVRGQRIAISGDTGVPGNPHLHFEVRQALDQVVDPYLMGLWR